ncbi:helix-turn-helix domain-containing protein [Rhodococcus sp. P1Y]|uniref:helix-turn-helix domain-containing protein n=1 Tax=Rhodococcus sp. P1Y TaxID=1302308 RepID=UPI00137A6075|nr:helix-turn-helix domain-containing protein [Rhodococcus sp. P1Y]
MVNTTASVESESVECFRHPWSDGSLVVDVAERFGVSRQTVTAWRKRYEATGLDGLVDASRRPHLSPARIDPNVEALICEIRRHRRRWVDALSSTNSLSRLATERRPDQRSTEHFRATVSSIHKSNWRVPSKRAILFRVLLPMSWAGRTGKHGWTETALYRGHRAQAAPCRLTYCCRQSEGGDRGGARSIGGDLVQLATPVRLDGHRRGEGTGLQSSWACSLHLLTNTDRRDTRRP